MPDPAYNSGGVSIYHGDVLDVLRQLPDGIVQTCVTSPPYWGLRTYGVEGQLGLEPTPEEYVAKMVSIFREVRRVLRDDGTLWLNLGDSFWNGGSEKRDGGHGFVDGGKVKLEANRGALLQAKATTSYGLKPKDLCGIPWRVALALQKDGWYLRSDIIWSKPSPMPESCTDRPTKAHEYIFLLSKKARYYYDGDAIREPCAESTRERDRYSRITNTADDEPYAVAHDHESDSADGTRNKWTVWTVAAQPTGSSRISRWVRVEPGDVYGGMRHIVSQGCPVHGDSSAPVSTASCGEHEAGSSTRTDNTGGRLAQAPPDDSASIDRQCGGCSSGDSWDSPDRQYDPSAIDHSSQIRKTDRVPATNLSCTPCVETSPRTGDTSESLGSVAPHPGMHESNTWPGEMDAHSLDRIPHRTVDRSSLPISPNCTCVFYKHVYKNASHFATYPRKLIEPCILAGSTDRACAACGKPWRRVVEKETSGRTDHDVPDDGPRDAGIWSGRCGESISVTLGHVPDCKCGTTETRPSIVLDPFMGSGTTAEVARKHGCECIGIELNAEYIELAGKRLAQGVLEFGG